MIRFALMLGWLFLAAACRQAEKPDDKSADVPGRPDVGSWVCPKSDSTELLASCPVLVVSRLDSVGQRGKESKIMVIGAMGLRDTLESSAVEVIGDGPIGSLVGATDEIFMLVNYAWGLRLGEKGNYLRQFGLVFDRKGGLDTVEFFESGDRLGQAPGDCADTVSWSECLARYPGYGLLHKPILPGWDQIPPANSVWTLDERNGFKPKRGWRKRRMGSKSLFYQERSNSVDKPRFFEVGHGSWVLNIGEKLISVELLSDTTQRISDSQIDHVVREISFLQESKREWILGVVESGSSYPDGNFEDLYLLSFHPDRDTLHAKVVPFTGSSGESGGSTVEGSWWRGIGPNGHFRLYVATAQEGNETGESRELEIAVFEVADSGEIQPVTQAEYDVVTFGTPSSRESADAFFDTVLAGGQIAKTTDLRAIPMLIDGRTRWVAAMVAPNESTARAWSEWHRSGEVRRVKSAPAR